jgi:hypothetical protein
MQGLVPRAAPRDERYFARFELAPTHELQPWIERNDVCVRRGKTLQRFGQNSIDMIDEFFHGVTLIYSAVNVVYANSEFITDSADDQRHGARARVDMA